MKKDVPSLKQLTMGTLHLNLYQKWRPYDACPHLYVINYKHQPCFLFSLWIPFSLKQELIQYSHTCERHYGKYDVVFDEESCT